MYYINYKYVFMWISVHEEFREIDFIHLPTLFSFDPISDYIVQRLCTRGGAIIFLIYTLEI